MTEKEVIEAIEYMQKYQTETDKLEAKTAEIDFPKKCYDTISGFANKYGGIIIFGINEYNSFIEQDVYNVNDLQKQLTSLCTNSIEPKIRPEFLPITYNNKTLLAVKIDEIPQNKKPCYYKNAGINKGSYIRIGDSDEPMTDYEIYSLQSYKDGIQEDLRPIKRAAIDDLDKEKIDLYLEKTKKNKPNFSKFSDEKILKLSGIIENSTGIIYPTLSGLMMFGEYPQGYLPQLFVACVVVPGTKLGDIGEMGQRFDDNKRVEGTLDEMLDQTLTFIRRNIGTKIIIDNTGKRENIPEYPMKALREAVANALIHRDYSISRESAYIYVQIYDDRIEIINPGDLYGNNRLENLGTDMMLEARNKNIVKLLEEKGDIIENRHTGIATMREEMRKSGLPEPEFQSLRGDFKVIFRKEKIKNSEQNKNEEFNEKFVEK
ncbi:MAG: ATP-binding protein, partial [Eubacteriales bacterium]|nr:ATP-binding protein [Eubacteriales bacterium]